MIKQAQSNSYRHITCLTQLIFLNLFVHTITHPKEANRGVVWCTHTLQHLQLQSRLNSPVCDSIVKTHQNPKFISPAYEAELQSLATLLDIQSLLKPKTPIKYSSSSSIWSVQTYSPRGTSFGFKKATIIEFKFASASHASSTRLIVHTRAQHVIAFFPSSSRPSELWSPSDK